MPFVCVWSLRSFIIICNHFLFFFSSVLIHTTNPRIQNGNSKKNEKWKMKKKVEIPLFTLRPLNMKRAKKVNKNHWALSLHFCISRDAMLSLSPPQTHRSIHIYYFSIIASNARYAVCLFLLFIFTLKKINAENALQCERMNLTNLK